MSSLVTNQVLIKRWVGEFLSANGWCEGTPAIFAEGFDPIIVNVE